MTDSSLALSYFRRKLIGLRQELIAADVDNEAAGIVELDQSRVGRLSRMDAMQGQAMAQASNRRREAMLAGIEKALARIESGVYGGCIDCDEPINPQRLEADPIVRRCINCAVRTES